MPNIDAFLDETARELRWRLVFAGDAARCEIEDALALLTDYRVSGMDLVAFERLLAMLRSGRSPVALASTAPQAIARDLTARWAAYEAAERVPALT